MSWSSREDIATVPKGVILCILTPLNRYSFQNINEIKELLNILSDLNERKKFLKNPCCYGKNSIGNLFEYATIYFENQKYFNLELSIGTENDYDKKYDGIYDNNNLLNTYKRNDVDSDNASIIPNKDNFQSNLSLLLQENMGVVVIKCCRACDTYLENNIIQNIYRYEHFINVVNRSIKNNSEEDYNNCTKKTERCKYIAKFKKVRNHYTNNSKKIERQIKALQIRYKKYNNPRILGNKSIGISYQQNRKEEEFKEREFFPDNVRDDIKNMIDCFQENSSDLDIFKKYEEFNIKLKGMNSNDQKNYSNYFKKNIGIGIEHFCSYVFYKNYIEEEDLYFVTDFNCENMTKIYLRNCNIEDFKIPVYNFYIITELYLSGNSLNNFRFLSTFQSFRNKITKIDISNNNISDEKSDILNSFSGLQDLNLSGNKLTNIDFIYKDAISNLKTLTKLNISNNNILYLPNSLNELTNLTDLNLINNKLLLLDIDFINQNIIHPEKKENAHTLGYSDENISTLKNSIVSRKILDIYNLSDKLTKLLLPILTETMLLEKISTFKPKNSSTTSNGQTAPKPYASPFASPYASPYAPPYASPYAPPYASPYALPYAFNPDAPNPTLSGNTFRKLAGQELWRTGLGGGYIKKNKKTKKNKLNYNLK